MGLLGFRSSIQPYVEIQFEEHILVTRAPAPPKCFPGMRPISRVFGLYPEAIAIRFYDGIARGRCITQIHHTDSPWIYFGERVCDDGQGEPTDAIPLSQFLSTIPPLIVREAGGRGGWMSVNRLAQNGEKALSVGEVLSRMLAWSPIRQICHHPFGFVSPLPDETDVIHPSLLRKELDW